MKGEKEMSRSDCGIKKWENVHIWVVYRICYSAAKDKTQPKPQLSYGLHKKYWTPLDSVHVCEPHTHTI